MHAVAKCQSVLHPSDNVPSFNSQCILNSQVFPSKCKQWTTIDYSRKRTDVAFARDIKHLTSLSLESRHPHISTTTSIA